MIQLSNLEKSVASKAGQIFLLRRIQLDDRSPASS